jgi:hypothetical protein
MVFIHVVSGVIHEKNQTRRRDYFHSSVLLDATLQYEK